MLHLAPQKNIAAFVSVWAACTQEAAPLIGKGTLYRQLGVAMQR